MKTRFILPIIMCIGANIAVAKSFPKAEKAAIDTTASYHNPDSSDIFYQHLELGEVVITGLAGDTKVKRMPSSVSVIRPTDLWAKASTHIIGTLEQQPGISEVTTGPGISKPVIRGLGYNRVVVVNDGIRQEGQQWGDEHGIELDGAAVYSAEVLKGPASLMYGSDALSGVIIFHPEPVAQLGSVGGSFESEYQTNSKLINYSASTNGNINNWVWNVRSSGKWAQAYKNSFDGRVSGSGFREDAQSAMIGKNGDWGYSRLKFSRYHIRPGIIEEDAPDRFGSKPALPFQQIHHYKVVSDNTFLIGDGELKAIIGWQQNRRQEFEESAGEPGLDLKLNTVNYDIKYISANLNGWKLAGGVGGMYQKSKNQGDEFLIPDYSLFDAGAFATASFKAENWTFSGGLRADLRRLQSKASENRFEAFSRNFKGVSASLGAVRNFGESFTVRANVARGFRAPNISELGSNGEHEGTFRYEVGNHGLKPENSLQFDLGADFTSKYISVQSALFLSRISNFIFLAGTGEYSADGDPVFTYSSGTATLKGAEVGVDIHPVHSLHIASAFSYVFGKERSGEYLPMIPAPRLFSEVKYEISHDGDLLNNSFVAINLDWTMKQDRVYSVGNTESASAGYALLGASIGTDLVLNGRTAASFYIIASNLTDKVYRPHLSRLPFASPGRNVTIKMLLPF